MHWVIIVIGLLMLATQAYAQTCVAATMQALNDPTKSTALIMATGKQLNDLGDIDGCMTTPGMKYGVMSLQIGGAIFMHLGMCLPEQCQSEDMQLIGDAMVVNLKGYVTSASFKFPDEFEVEMTAWRALGITLFTLIALASLIGVIVEFTPLFNKPANVDPKKEDPAQNKTIVGKVFISFSPSRNLKKLFYAPFNSNDDLKVLNGVRFFSMLYVVLGHAYFNMLIMPTINLSYIHEFVQPLWFQIIIGGVYAVDVFFYLSGFLGAYLMITKFEGKKFMNFALIYFHRFYRLVPNILLVTLFFMTFFQYFGSGPVWSFYSNMFMINCPKYWWTNILFINTLYPVNQADVCIGWLWYLSHDMIFFIILPFQVLAYLFNRFAGYMTVLIILLMNLIVVISLTYAHNISSSTISDPNYQKYIYFKPWSRAGAYQVGVLVGMLYYEYAKGNKPDGDRSKTGYKIFKIVNLSAVVRYTCYVLGFGLIMFSVFGATPENRNLGAQDQNGKTLRYFPTSYNAFFNAFSRPAYVFGLALILAGPITGKGSFLQVFLGSRFYAPWAKLSFYSYLIHLFVFTWFLAQMRTTLYLNHLNVLWIYSGVIFFALLLAIPFSVLFEAPWMQLESLVFFPKKQKPKKDTTVFEKIRINDSDLDSSLKTDDDSPVDFKQKLSRPK